LPVATSIKCFKTALIAGLLSASFAMSGCNEQELIDSGALDYAQKLADEGDPRLLELLEAELAKADIAIPKTDSTTNKDNNPTDGADSTDESAETPVVAETDTESAGEEKVADVPKTQTGGKATEQPVDMNQEPVPMPKEELAMVERRPTLDWEAPVSREDGTLLAEDSIKGYRVYFKLKHESEFAILDISGATETSLKLQEFDPGAWEFAVSTVDKEGLESQRSETVTVNLI